MCHKKRYYVVMQCHQMFSDNFIVVSTHCQPLNADMKERSSIIQAVEACFLESLIDCPEGMPRG